MVGAIRLNALGIGAALRELRQASEKTANVVARHAAMSNSKLSKIENGRLAPSVIDVERILGALGVSAEVKEEFMKAARVAATGSGNWAASLIVCCFATEAAQAAPSKAHAVHACRW